MEGIEPIPWGKSFVVVLTVKLKSFDILLDDHYKLQAFVFICDIEPTFIVIANTLHYLIVLNLEFL